MYLPPAMLTAKRVRHLVSRTRHDVLYINSCFSVPFGIVPLALRRLRLIPSRPLILAPRGELAPGALALNAGRKRSYLTVARLVGLMHGVRWQASGTHEEGDIRRLFGNRAQVVVAPDLATVNLGVSRPRFLKEAGQLRLLFLSRISPMKNLDGALRLLEAIVDPIQFNIYGPIEDADYWKRCGELLARLPPNVEARYLGEVDPAEVCNVLSQHDLLLLPTRGENFGHVILEALACGCPVLISDRTRWRGLEELGVGWDVPLEDSEQFRRILRRCVALDDTAWSIWSERGRKYGAEQLAAAEPREQNRRLFRGAEQGQAYADVAQ